MSRCSCPSCAGLREPAPPPLEAPPMPSPELQWIAEKFLAGAVVPNGDTIGGWWRPVVERLLREAGSRMTWSDFLHQLEPFLMARARRYRLHGDVLSARLERGLEPTTASREAQFATYWRRLAEITPPWIEEIDGPPPWRLESEAIDAELRRGAEEIDVEIYRSEYEADGMTPDAALAQALADVNAARRYREKRRSVA